MNALDRDDNAVLDALRKGPRARSGLARAIKDAGSPLCKPGGDDRWVVFALDRLRDKGYVIHLIGVRGGGGRCRYHLLAEPLTAKPVAG